MLASFEAKLSERRQRSTRGEASRGARIYSAKSKPQRDRGHQVTNYFESPSIKSKVACRLNEHESARLIEHRTYPELSLSPLFSLSLSRSLAHSRISSLFLFRSTAICRDRERISTEEAGECCLLVSGAAGEEGGREIESQCQRFSGHLKIDRNLFTSGGSECRGGCCEYRGSRRNASRLHGARGRKDRFAVLRASSAIESQSRACRPSSPVPSLSLSVSRFPSRSLVVSVCTLPLQRQTG